MRKTYYYNSYKDDVVQSKNQNYNLKEDYKWIKNNIFYKIYSSIIYFFAYIFGIIYCKYILHVKIKNSKILKKYKGQGYFLYGNHTQIIGDVFIPAYVCKSKRIYTIVSRANLGIKGIGKILPSLGALPIPNTITNMKNFKNAIEKRIKEKKCIVIYPEAHVWPYYTKIRPYEKGAFKYPVDLDAPSFSMTTTYYKRKFGKKPGIIVYIDGPVLTNKELNKKENQEKICEEIHKTMENRSKNSTYEYIEYVKER